MQNPRDSDTGTPVDIGWARNNWIPSLGKPTDTPVGSRDPGVGAAAAAQAKGTAEVLGYDVRRDGHSRQAPRGFVQRAIRKAVRSLRNFRL